MESFMADIKAELKAISGKLSKLDELDSSVKDLVKENAALRSELSKKDEKIAQLSDQVNRLEQNTRSTSLRIIGLPITTASPSSSIPEIVFKEIIAPCLAAARAAGDIPASTSTLHPHSVILNAFAIPSKKNAASNTVILKMSSDILRSCIFKHKKEALPSLHETSSGRVRSKYGIYEDMSPANHAHFRIFADDSRVHKIWSYSGQIRFKIHNSETVYKVKSLSDTVDSIVKS
jgi:hypothetical protein